MDQFIDIDGIRTRYRRVGDGPACSSCTAGARGSRPSIRSSTRWRASCTVYAPDLPGFGETGPPPQQPWGVADYAVWTRALMDALGLRAPEHRRPLARGDDRDQAGRRPPRAGRQADPGRRGRDQAPAHLALPPPGGDRQARQARARGCSAARAGAGASACSSATRPRTTTTPGEMRPTLVRLVNEDITELLPSVRASTLLIWGDRDDATPLSDGQTMERLIPDAGLVVFEGAGHFSYLDERAAVRGRRVALPRPAGTAGRMSYGLIGVAAAALAAALLRACADAPDAAPAAARALRERAAVSLAAPPRRDRRPVDGAGDRARAGRGRRRRRRRRR